MLLRFNYLNDRSLTQNKTVFFYKAVTLCKVVALYLIFMGPLLVFICWCVSFLKAFLSHGDFMWGLKGGPWNPPYFALNVVCN